MTIATDIVAAEIIVAQTTGEIGVVVDSHDVLVEVDTPTDILVEVAGAPGPPGQPGQPGQPGPPGPTAVSADAGNTATLGSDSLIFVPVSFDQASADARYVNVDGDTITNAILTKSGLIVERTVPSTSTSDAEIFVVKYGGKRSTWTNEKGNLRTSNEAAKAEVALKVIGASQAEGGTGDAMQVMDLAGNVAVRVGVLGRLNAAKGMRLVGDTLQIRDSTEADESTISQPLSGDMLIAPKRNLSVNNKKITNVATPTATTDAANKAYADARIWKGTRAAYDAIVTKDPTVLYVITG